MSDISPQLPTDIDLSEVELIILGEAPGSEEEKQGIPFVGKSGNLLDTCLKEIGMPRSKLYITNVFWTRPPNNDRNFFFAKKSLTEEVCNDYPIYKNLKLKEEWKHELERLDEELFNLQPKAILALGGTSTWALLGMDKITKIRGEVDNVKSHLKQSQGLTVIPAYHPAYVLRNGKDSKQMEEFVQDLSLAKSFTNL